MKTNAIRSYCYCARRRPASRYPNSASRRYILDKLLDTALATAITVAVIAILLFLFVIL